MAKKMNENVNGISKYAAKKMNAANNASKMNKEIEEANNNVNSENTEMSDTTSQYRHNRINKNKYDKKANNGIPFAASSFPEHVVQIALLIKNNAEIRRFTALGIINYLLQKQEIVGERRYVVFKWNKFAIKVNGLMREYSYNEPFFLNALVAAFTSFSASAQRTINNFCKNEMNVNIDKAADQEEINNIIELNEKYQQTKVEVSEE